MNIKQFNSFDTSYKRLKEKLSNSLLKISLEYYHHDFQSEPFLLIDAYPENIRIKELEEHGKIILITTKETMVTFTEKNYNTNLSNDSVVFYSKFDEETYCIIQFI